MVEHHLAKVGVAGSNPVFRSILDGALAQLGERLLCTQEVSGSIPLGSTITLHIKLCLKSHRFKAFFIEKENLQIKYDAFFKKI